MYASDDAGQAALAGTVMPPVYRKRHFTTATVVLVFAGLLAWKADSNFTYGLLSSWMILSIVGLGFYLVFGLGGQFAFSQAAFFGLGAYTSAWITREMPFLWGFTGAIVISALVALAFSMLVFRTSHFYFAIATLAFSHIALIVFREAERFTGPGGEVLGIKRAEILGFRFDNDARVTGLLLGALTLALVLVALIERSPLRREALAFHHQPVVAATLGIPVNRLRLLMFVLGSCFAAAAGSLQAHRSGFISTDGFSLGLAIDIFLVLLLGGMASMWGPLIGAAFVVWAPEQLRFIGSYRGLVYGSLLIAVIVLFPKGLVGLAERAQQAVRSTRRHRATR